jgi:hypothetical protein
MTDELQLDIDTSPRQPDAIPRVAPRAFSRAPVAPPVARRAPGVSREALRDFLVEEIFKPAFRPMIAADNVWRFADKRVVLNPAGTGRGGYYESSKTPWCRRFQESFTDVGVREHHVMKCSRSGYTEAGLNIIRFMPENAPGPVHFAAGSEKKTKEINKDRLTPTLKRLGIFAADDTDPDDITATLIRLGNMVIRISGSYTEGAFRADGNRVEMLDEVELVGEIKNAGTIHDLGRSRIRGVEGARLFSMSKPLQWGSAHHKEVVTGTLEAYLVPCPCCGTFQELTLDGSSPTHALRLEEPEREGATPLSPRLSAAPVRLGKLVFDHCKDLYHGWDHGRLLSDTYYQCVAGCRIDQDTLVAPLLAANPIASGSFSAEVHELVVSGRPLTCKQAMMLSGRWIATNPRPIPGKRSSHLSDLCSLDRDMTWGHFASIFVQAAHDPAKLRTFNNEHMGMPHRERAAAVGDEHITECRAAYERGTIPFVPDIVCLCADSQLYLRKHVVVAARLDASLKAWRDIAVLDWGYTATKADLIAALAGFEDPDTKQRRRFTLSPLAFANHVGPAAFDPELTSATYLPSCGLVDAGGAEGNTDEVYELHFESQGVLYPSFGRGGQTAELRPTWSQELKNGWRGSTILIRYYWDDFWKRRMYLGSLKKVSEIKQCQERENLDPSAKGLPPRLWLPAHPGDAKRREFESELQGEVINDRGDWVPAGQGAKNDFGDALKMCYVTLDLRLPAIAAEKARARAESEAASAPK